MWAAIADRQDMPCASCRHRVDLPVWEVGQDMFGVALLLLAIFFEEEFNQMMLGKNQYF
jgi:hypothetical protein